MILLNDPFISPDQISEILFPPLQNRILTCRIDDFNKDEIESFMTNIRVGRSVQQLQDNQKYIISFV